MTLTTRGWKAKRRGFTVLFVAGFSLVAVPLPGAADQALAPDLPVIGALPDAPPRSPDGREVATPRVVGVWPERKELLVAYLLGAGTPEADVYLRSYDLGPRLPQVKREGVVARGTDLGSTTVSSRLITIDTRRGFLILLGQGQAGTVLYVVDLDTFKLVERWDLQTEVPGFVGYAMTYAERDDRIYLIGDWSGNAGLSMHQNGAILGGRPAWPSGVIAIDAQDGAVVWTRIIPHCQQPLNMTGLGSLIARSTSRPALYFGCMRLSFYPGSSGVVRLTVTGDEQDASDIPVEFFPISGQFNDLQRPKGLAVFDHETDRFFVQSMANSTPGAWVFDGKLSAWVGHVAADSAAFGLGLNPATGHLYMGKDAGGGHPPFFLVTDGRATPTPQGLVVPFAVHAVMQPDIIAEPFERRIFLPVADLGAHGLGAEGEEGWLVIQDQTPDAIQQEPVPFDDLTLDIQEGSSTRATFAGSSSGFGARILLVGGYGGLISLRDFQTASGPRSFAGLSPGDRGIFLARAGSVDVRNAGVSSSAQGIAPDTLSDNDVRTKRHDVEAASEDAGPAADAGKQVAGQIAWPWSPLACLVIDEETMTTDDETAGATAEITCDGKQTTSESHSEAGPLKLSPADGIELKLANSSFSTTVARTEMEGTITETLAEADGLKVVIEGMGSVSIEEIVSRVRTVAHGRPGTGRVTYERPLAGVTIRDADGEVVYRCEEDCDARDVVEAANDQLETRVRFRVPNAEVRATPRGAFAGVQKTESDRYNDLTTNNDGLQSVPALEMTIFNDTVEKSRLVMQFASVQASSIYGISLLPTADQPGPLPQPPTPSLGGILDSPPPPDHLGQPPAQAPEEQDAGSVLERVPRGTLLLIRSPKEAFLVSLLGLLLLGTALAVRRRGQLLRSLQD